MKAGLVASYDAIELWCKYEVTAGSASASLPYSAAYGGEANGWTEYSDNPLRNILSGMAEAEGVEFETAAALATGHLAAAASILKENLKSIE